MCQWQPAYIKGYEGLVHNEKDRKTSGVIEILLLLWTTCSRNHTPQGTNLPQAAPTGLALKRLKPQEPASLTVPVRAYPWAADAKYTLADVGRQFSSQRQRNVQNVSQTPKLPGSRADRSKHPLITA